MKKYLPGTIRCCYCTKAVKHKSGYLVRHKNGDAAWCSGTCVRTETMAALNRENNIRLGMGTSMFSASKIGFGEPV